MIQIASKRLSWGVDVALPKLELGVGAASFAPALQDRASQMKTRARTDRDHLIVMALPRDSELRTEALRRRWQTPQGWAA